MALDIQIHLEQNGYPDYLCLLCVYFREMFIQNPTMYPIAKRFGETLPKFENFKKC